MREVATAGSGRVPEARPERVQLDERYVTEWLGAMTTGGIVDHDPDRGTYTLPPEHAALPTRDAGADNLAVIAQYIPLLGAPLVPV